MSKMIRLKTPLVILTVLVVTVLGIARLVLLPDSRASSLVALLFLPMAIGFLVILSRRATDPERAKRTAGRLRAGLVGAGVLLASSLLLSITDALGLTEPSSSQSGRSLMAIFAALVAVAVDLLSARLEHEAEKDPD